MLPRLRHLQARDVFQRLFRERHIVLRALLFYPTTGDFRGSIRLRIHDKHHVHGHQPPQTRSIVPAHPETLESSRTEMAVVLVVFCCRLWNHQWIHQHRRRSELSAEFTHHLDEFVLFLDDPGHIGGGLGERETLVGSIPSCITSYQFTCCLGEVFSSRDLGLVDGWKTWKIWC